MGGQEPCRHSIGRLDRSKRPQGLLIALGAVLLITPDAMLVRWASSLGATPWQILFWKQSCTGIINTATGIHLAGGLRATCRGVAAAPAHLLFASLIQMASQLGFNFAFIETSTARAMLFISLNPLWAGLFGRCFLREVLPYRTIIALVVGALSSLVVFVPSLLPSSPDEDSVSIRGDIIALLTGISLAAWITMMRYTLGRRPDAAIDLAAGLGNLLAGLCALGMLLPPGYESLTANLDLSFVIVTGVDILCTAGFFVGFVVVPRYLLGAELALILLLETLLAPFWVFFKFGDVPSVWTMAGGALLILALIVHEMADIRAKRIALSRTPSAPALCGTLEAGHSEGPPTTIAVRIEGAVPPDAPYQRFDSVRSSGKV
uniref:EamA domain-containing protein n=1 Tax=Chrysotila carterae TaxID=13221 RepID=A0A7S4FAF5_CHRCT